MLASRDPEALQQAMDVCVDLFERAGLRASVKKTKIIVCISGKSRTCLSRAS